MAYYKFECESQKTAQKYIASRSLPPSFERQSLSPKKVFDTYQQTCDKLNVDDGVVLATLVGKEVYIFAIGRAARAYGESGPWKIDWVPSPGLIVHPNELSELENWQTKTAHEISDGPANHYQLAEKILELTVLSADERLEYIKHLKNKGYTGKRLDDASYLADLLHCLEEEGFQVFASGKKGSGGNTETLAEDDECVPVQEGNHCIDDDATEKRGTIRIESNGKYVAYIADGKAPFAHLCGLAYFKPGSTRTVQAVPRGFGLEELATFAMERGVPPEHLELEPKKGQGQQYIRIADLNTALTLIRQNAALLDPTYISDKAPERKALQDDDERVIRQRQTEGKISANLCKQLIDARRGQGRYREALMKRFGRRCSASGLALEAALRASHVLAWSKCNEAQQLDPDNGLLLSADLDALFDRYLITFDEKGALRCSTQLDGHQEHPWPLQRLHEPPTEKQWSYLRFHNREFDRLEAIYLARKALAAAKRRYS
jgi:hypothetical protein